MKPFLRTLYKYIATLAKLNIDGTLMKLHQVWPNRLNGEMRRGGGRGKMSCKLTDGFDIKI